MKLVIDIILSSNKRSISRGFSRQRLIAHPAGPSA
jgi:hypothetical protein